MNALCEFFPGADTPINYDDCEDDDTECSEDEYMQYSDTQDSLETDNLTTYLDETASQPVGGVDRDRVVPSPRPRSFVETQVSKLQTLMAEGNPKGGVALRNSDEDDCFPPRRLPYIQKGVSEPNRSTVTINRTSSSPVPSDRTYVPSEGSIQDSLDVKSPNVFSESSSPRRLSPIANYNIGNMNPRHIDLEQYWNRENEKLSSTRSPSVTSNSNSMRKEDFNQNYCNSTRNSPISPSKEYNGNMAQRQDTRYQTPLQIEVDPVSQSKINSIYRVVFTSG